jgi:mannosylglycerate hydrolase
VLSLTSAPGPAAARPPVYRVFVYHHTHWDREWWATFQDFRIQLVRRIDELLDALDADAAFGPFLLDGQNIVLDDYLAVRPEQRERLLGHIRAGRIECGPWYVLPDELLVSGEAHIRNLWLGRRVAERLGFANQRLGYLPDTFGHIGQMPQLLRGFGLECALVWRGLGGSPEHCKQEFIWEAPDGSQVFGYWFPDGYYLVDFLHFDNPAKSYGQTFGRVRRSLELIAARATTDCLLLPYGGDHRPADPRLPRLLEEANAELHGADDALGFTLEWATPSAFLEAVRAERPALRVRRGELRDAGHGTPHLLPGVLSSRLYLKRRNAECQAALERNAEPLAALAWVRGARYDAGLLWHAWELLVQNHPHDSICGCSIDQVHREMLVRFDQAHQIATIVAEQSAEALAARVDTSGLADGARAIVAQNTLAFARSGLIGVLLDRDAEPDLSPRTHALRDADGRELPFQTRDVEGLRPRSDRFRWRELRFVAEDVPAFGHATFLLARRDEPLDPRQVHYTSAAPAARLKGSLPSGDLRVGPGMLENRFLRVEVEPAGTLRVSDKITGEVYRGLNAFEDGGDAGDTYSYAAPIGDYLLRSDSSGARVHVSLAEAGPAAATLRVEVEWALPQALSVDRLSRVPEYVPARMVSMVTLASGARRVEVACEWENMARDHRLRALFPLGHAHGAASCHALGHFEVLSRAPVDLSGSNGAAELPPACFPQQGFVSMRRDGRGLSILAQGLPEAELLPDGTLALTLLRAVGWLSRDDLASRVGHAGPLLPTPEAQCLGAQRAAYAIVPHAGGWLEEGIAREADDFQAPMPAAVTGAHRGELPPRGGLLSLEGHHSLLLSACKKAERSEALVLRLWNSADQPTSAWLRLARPGASVCYLNLDEEMIAPLEPDADGSFRVAAGPAQIITLAIR